jgi:hypothetical protein
MTESARVGEREARSASVATTNETETEIETRPATIGLGSN